MLTIAANHLDRARHSPAVYKDDHGLEVDTWGLLARVGWLPNGDDACYDTFFFSSVPETTFETAGRRCVPSDPSAYSVPPNLKVLLEPLTPTGPGISLSSHAVTTTSALWRLQPSTAKMPYGKT